MIADKWMAWLLRGLCEEIGGVGLESLRHVWLRRVVAPSLRVLGLRPTLALARRLARGIHELHPPGRARAERRAAACLGREASTAEVAALVRDSYVHQGRFWAECLFLRRYLREKTWRRHVEVVGEPALRGLAESGRGCLLAMPYFGSPTVAVCTLGRIFRPVHVVVDVLAAPGLRSFQRELFRQPWVVPVERSHAAKVVPGILDAGSAVVLIAESERRRGRAVLTTFLGRDLNLYPTLGRLARWHDVPVCPVTCRRRDARFAFTLEAHDMFDPRRETWDVADAVRCVMRSLEEAILRDPAQYLWSVETQVDRQPGLAPSSSARGSSASELSAPGSSAAA